MRLIAVLAFILSLQLAAAPPAADSLVVTRTSASRLLIPAAGAVAGANDTFFRSDIRIANLGSAPQVVEMTWLPRDGWEVPPRLNPSAGVVVRRTLEVGEMLHSDDFVTEILATEGLGAILVRALTPEGNEVDLAARLQASGRIWTSGVDGGTVSQSFPAVALADIVSENVAILGHRRDADFRTNVGIVNLDDSDAHRFLVTVGGETPTLVPEIYEVEVPPYGIALFPIEGADQTRMRIDVQIIPAPGGGTLTLWQAFASTVDNRTGDAWSTLAFEVPR